jgi:ADP-ribose pyrophosphatase YjhB (NUDIX family)
VTDEDSPRIGADPSAEDAEGGFTAHGVHLEPVGNGVSRVSWSTELQERGLDVAAAAVREEVTLALERLKQARVEALVDPDDTGAARVATWAGLQREGVMRGVVEESGERRDRVVFARLHTDVPSHRGGRGFRAILNSFLPRKRAIGQLLVRDPHDRVLLCQLTYKSDWDLPGGVVEVGESPATGVAREVREELAVDIDAGQLLITDWLPAWSGWDDALTLVYDGGVHDESLLASMVREEREIRSVEFCTLEQVRERCADFTARRIEAALASAHGSGVRYTESGRPVG